MGTEPAWMQDENFPLAPADGSYGILVGWRRKRADAQSVMRTVRSGALRLTGLVWTPASERILPAWDHPMLVDAAWIASKRFWIGMSIIAGGLLAVDLLSPPLTSGLAYEEHSELAHFVDVLTSALPLLFCAWQAFRAFRRSPIYADQARNWLRFGAFGRLRGSWWSESLCLALLIVFFCQSLGAHKLAGADARAITTVKLAQSYDTVVGGGQWWRIFTSPLIHNGPPHLLSVLVLLVFFGRWMSALAPRAVFPLVLAMGSWGGMIFAMADTLVKPALGFSGALSAIVGFMVVIWLRTKSLPPYLGPVLFGTYALATLSDVYSTETISASGHAGGFFVGLCLGFLLVRPAAKLPIAINPLVDLAGTVCGVMLLTLAAAVSLNIAGVVWAQW